MSKYNVIWGSDGKFGRGGSDLVKDFMTSHSFYESSPGIEEKIERLATLVGRISDKLGLNLLELIDESELNDKYEYAPKE